MNDPLTTPRPKITFIVTAAISTVFYKGQLGHLAENGWDVEIVSSPGPQLDEMSEEGATAWSVPIEREIALGKDIVSLWRLWRLLRRTRPDMVVAGTPKAGLLGTVAARLAGVPHVVYKLHGLRLETASGWKRRLLSLTEWIACHVQSVSPSLRARMIDLGLVEPERCSVIGLGTSNGVEIERWSYTPEAKAIGIETRHSLGLSREVPILGFVGRFVRDKGILELYEAFRRLQSDCAELRLLLVGDFEEGDPVPQELRDRIEADPAVVRTGFIADVAPYYWAMSIFVLPTYREGFPGAPLEAQAACLPVVTTDATGATDAIIDGVTGIRVPTGDVGALTAALASLLADPQLRTSMGQEGCAWVRQNFRRETVWQAQLADYRRMLLHPARPRQSGARKHIKVAIDRCVAALALILTMPLWLLAALVIRLELGSPILFRQERPGKGGHPFTLLKFRTMRDTRDQAGELLDDNRRLTSLGRLLRALSIDELPQLWNVLRGEMSLVGPRPLLMQYLDRYTPAQARRHKVMPGITGWAQVNGRNAIGWEEKFALDVWYVDNWSLVMDLRILALTLFKVLRRSGISSHGHATMPEFLGDGDGGETGICGEQK
jgi:lipopolysaccharide/colanic/teichoic acid biosynthesis glycosyltransferase